jgi:hypothetical protein
VAAVAFDVEDCVGEDEPESPGGAVATGVVVEEADEEPSSGFAWMSP